ncbi:hypothetical protein [Alkalicoccus halolimnae]|uniref:Uncharacterized protein n=1 Tax=Alkalicoccus halolimnae TaxID=1667239 RepID=A0A5C7F925_9BACI|nr:hypothetical protein [Alkalicoccus halolimnae]TXF85868.1 hypothetical protein FTX54_07255 [Alkalicoccus halolimnae]
MSLYRIISFIVLFTGVGVTLYFYTLNSHFTMDSHDHGEIDIPAEEENVPAVDGEIVEKADGTHEIRINTEHFSFVRSSEKNAGYHEGHAHIYVNGEKESRLYGERYQLGQMKEEALEITVSLYTNDHRALMHEEKPIETTMTYP